MKLKGQHMKIIIIDDEPLICEYIRECIIQCKTSHEIIGMFYRAADALAFIENNPVDLILTDITMPDMDGLELSDVINEKYSKNIDVVILTCHQNFDFARQAMTYNVKDYIIKSEIDIPRMKKLLDSIEETHKKTLSLKELSNHYSRSQLLQTYIKNTNISDDSSEIDCQNVLLPDKPYFVFVFPKNSMVLEKLSNYYDSLLINSFLFLNETATRYIFVSNVNCKDNNLTDCRKAAYELFSYAAQYCDSYCGISEIHFDESTLGKAIIYADKMANSAYYSIADTSIPSDLSQEKLSKILSMANSAITAIIDQNEIEYIKTIDKIMDFNGSVAMIDPEQLCSILRYIIMSASPHTSDTESLYSYVNRIYTSLSFLKTKEIINEYKESFRKKHKYSEPIESAVKYIEANFAENFSLADISQHVFLSKEYFCRKFKSEVGTTFSEYRLYVQMREAYKAIISTNENINTIAENVGIYNVSYFSSAFKKHFGESPSNIRKLNI